MRDLQVVLQRQQSRRERVDEVVGDTVVVYGVVKVTDAGQGWIDLSFPVSFVERPRFSFGHELEQGFAVASVPTCSSTVMSWKTEELSSGSTRFNGCQLGFVVRGSEGLESYVHYQFRGMALTNPTAPSSNLDAQL